MAAESNEVPILFLSGAGLGPWIWDEVRAGLPVESVVAAYPKQRDATLRDCAAAVLEQMPTGQCVVVAHSIGGVVASELAALAPDRLAGVLGIAASFPAAGTSFLADMPVPQRLLLGAAMRIVGTQPPDKAIRSGLCGGLGEEVGSRIVTEFDPESPHLYRDPVAAPTFPARRGYLLTTEDRLVSADRQRGHADSLGAEFRPELPTGHLPMLQDPAAVSDIVSEFIRG
ncbi:MAG: alpha/beta hydrolase [Nocardia sp.]|nr:alpha/beta hydrolase [Nocardia sp.]